MTIVVDVDATLRQQVIKQMNKLINVLQATDLTESPAVSREMVLVRVRTAQETRTADPQGSRDLRRPRGRFLHRRLRHRSHRRSGKARRVHRRHAQLRRDRGDALRRGGRVARSRRSCASQPPGPHARRGARSKQPNGLLNRRSYSMAKRYYEKDADLEPAEGQDRRHHRLRQPGPRPRAEPARFRRRRGRRPNCRAARTGRRPRPPACSVMTAAEAAKAGRRHHDPGRRPHPGRPSTRSEIAPHMTAGKTLMFAHGFNIHFGQIVPPDGRRRDHDRAQGARPPRARAVHRRRRRARAGRRPPGRLRQGAASSALAYALALGCLKAGVIETTFKEETESDLFGEQAVLCGGVSELIRAGLRDPGRSRLRARDRLLRVPARAEAHRRPDLRGRPQLHALLGFRHRRVRRLHARPAHHQRADPRRR